MSQHSTAFPDPMPHPTPPRPSPAMLDLAVKRGFGNTLALSRRKCGGGFVMLVPAPNGTVTITGLDERNNWLAEYRCLTEDFNEMLVERMAHVVSAKAK